MSDRQTLLLVLVLLYLVECLFWVRRGGVVFRTWLGRRWRVVPDGELARNDNGGIHWLWPLPPLGEAVVCRAAPYSFGPAGVFWFTAETLHSGGRALHSGRFMTWETIRTTEARSKKLLINGEVVWQGDSLHAPARMAAWLAEMARLKPEQRLPKLEQAVNSAFDRGALASRLNELRAATGWLDTLCQCYFVYLFIGVPMVVSRFGWFPALWWLIPLLYAQGIAISVLFSRVHRRFLPHAAEDRFKMSLIYAMAPAGTARARDPLFRGIVEEFHPLCGAAALLTPQAFAEFGRHAWRDLKFPRIPECPSKEPAAVDTERWYREACLKAFGRLLAEAKLDPANWTKAPEPTESVHALYCPRCEAQFTKEATACQECGGRSLVPLGAPASSQPSVKKA